MTSDPSTGTATDPAGDGLRPPVQWLDDAPAPVDPSAWTDVEAHDLGQRGPVPPPAPSPIAADQPPKRRRVILLPRSLVGRLVMGVVSLVIVLVLATGIGTYFALRSFLYDRLDQQVQEVSSGSITELFLGNPTTVPPSVRAPQLIWAVALSADGSVLAEPTGLGGVETMSLSERDRKRLSAAPVGYLNIHASTGIHLRVVTREVGVITGGRTIPAVAVIGLSTDEVTRTLGRLFALEIAIGGSAVLLALVATSYGVRFSLRRLYRVTDTARDVAAELSPDGAGLDRRVPVSEPDTEVGQLAESMNTLLAAVETQFAARLANERRMRQFLADASHELRTPLTSIRGYAELSRMQRTQEGSADSRHDDNLARIESEGTRMSRLVDDLLTLARSDRGGGPVREIVDLGALAEEGVAGVRAAYPDRHVELSAPVGLTVLGDPDQLLRVVTNLATNAAVHTRPDGAVRVSVSWDGPDAVLRVVDDGPGLSPEDAAHVFERFWRADKARTRASGGSGLGMAIVAAVVADHGGTVAFDSTVSGGSTVTVRLPRDSG